jgi:hypothetical protein
MKAGAADTPAAVTKRWVDRMQARRGPIQRPVLTTRNRVHTQSRRALTQPPPVPTHLPPGPTRRQHGRQRLLRRVARVAVLPVQVAVASTAVVAAEAALTVGEAVLMVAVATNVEPRHRRVSREARSNSGLFVSMTYGRVLPRNSSRHMVFTY